MIRVGTCLCLIAIPFYIFRFSFLGIRTNVLEVMIGLTFLVSVVGVIVLRTKTEAQAGRMKFLALDLILPVLLLISVILASSQSAYSIKALGIFKGWFLFPAIFYWIATRYFDRKSISNLSLALFAPILGVSLLAILQHLGHYERVFYQLSDGTFFQYIADGRAFGVFESPNYLAMFLVPSLFLTLPAFDLVRRKWAQIILGLLYIVPLSALYFSGSRAGLLALLAGVIIFLFSLLSSAKMSKLKAAIYAGVAMVILIAANFGYLLLSLRVADPGSGGDRVRQEIYRYSVQLLQTNYLHGVGLGQFQDKIGHIALGNFSFLDFALPYALHPHNLILAVWLNLGALGIIVFAAIVYMFFKLALEAGARVSAFALAAMTAILVHGLFDATYFKNDLSVIFWLTIAYVAILHHAKISSEK